MEPELPIEAFAKRRERVQEILEADQVLLVATHPEQMYANDVERTFRPHNDFWYLTGFDEPHSAVLIQPDRVDVWLRSRDPKAEIWNGRRLGTTRATEALHVDGAHDIEGIGRDLAEPLAGKRVLSIVEHDPFTKRRAQRRATLEDGRQLIHSMRLRKDAAEIAMLKAAGEIGSRAMEEAAAQIRPGNHEYHVEAALLAAYRRRGSTGPGYPPIVGAGDNATILHYIRNADPIHANDLVLVDAGCEWGYYNSDITRTFPAGSFTDEAMQIYELVEQAQQASLHRIKPGVSLRDVHDASVLTLTEGLVELGILDDVESALKDHAYRAHFMHGTSHFLGLDVHDVGGMRDAEGKSRTLEPGMVLTVEPGLYFNTDYAPCPKQYAGMGVRIEDDVVVTEDGFDFLTNVERSADGVRALVGAS